MQTHSSQITVCRKTALRANGRVNNIGTTIGPVKSSAQKIWSIWQPCWLWNLDGHMVSCGHVTAVISRNQGPPTGKNAGVSRRVQANHPTPQRTWRFGSSPSPARKMDLSSMLNVMSHVHHHYSLQNKSRNLYPNSIPSHKSSFFV